LTARILVVDDDRSLLELLTNYLARLRYTVLGAPDGQTGLALLADTPVDLVVLDVTMPGLNGWQVLARIRAVSAVAVIMLTARAEETSVLRGFAGGADDYVTKPFSFAQLAARIKAVLDRAAPDRQASSSVLRGADLIVDIDRHLVLRSGEPIELTPTEFRMLVTLMRQPGRVLSVKQIVTEVWGAEYIEETGYIRRYVWHLRRKLERDPRAPRYILNERSIGYRFPPES
jgi:two-component system KDP operon response regulator KdpE